MKLSVVIPVYNEAATVLDVLARVRAAPFDKEIIVVDDASSDGTPDILRRLKDPDVIVLFHPRNRGKGAALRRAFSGSAETSLSCRTPISNMTPSTTRSW